MKQWYESLFENYANKYDGECFVTGTSGECDFIEKELNYNKKIKILDVGCGTGRHSIELAKRGYNITGIDLSDSQLQRAKEKASEQKLKINFIKMDARNISIRNEFDAAIMLCEGLFPLMETDEMNFQILENIEKVLKKPGKLIFTTLNGLFPLFHSVKDYLASKGREGDAEYKENNFNLMTFRDYNITSIVDDSGNKKEIKTNERYYVPSEITWLLKSLYFRKIDIFGAHLGKFSREDKLSANDFEMLVIAEKL